MRWILSMIALASCAGAAEPEAVVFKVGGKSLPYRLLKPTGTEAEKKYPLK
jgi:hypothetical protein